eukprot:4901659-Ditylum_brightwellii.AAC.1
MPLFSAVEKDLNKVYYFVTKKVLHDDAEHWIDELPELLICCFSPADMDKITTDTHPTHSYRNLPTEHIEDTVSVYNIMLSNLIAANASSKPDIVDVVAEDFLKNCWTAALCSVYSCTDTNSTQNLTVSRITDNNKSPAKQA